MGTDGQTIDPDGLVRSYAWSEPVAPLPLQWEWLVIAFDRIGWERDELAARVRELTEALKAAEPWLVPDPEKADAFIQRQVLEHVREVLLKE